MHNMSLSENYKRHSIKYRCSFALPQFHRLRPTGGPDPRQEWLRDTIGIGGWTVARGLTDEQDHTLIYFFERSEDLVLFKLKWA